MISIGGKTDARRAVLMQRLLSIICGLGLGVCLSQFPEFSQQYAQRLGGAIDELAAITANFDAAAARDGLSREAALARYDVNQDKFIVERGNDMRGVFARYEKLLAHQSALSDAGPIEKALSFASYYDPAIAARTWETYRPAVPVTAEGLGFGGAGLLAGYGLVGALALPFRRRRRQTA